LLDVSTGEWSPELLELFGIPDDALPAVTPSAGPLGVIGARGGVLAGLPITAVLGDSHAALFAHSSPGAKVTYGTGSSVMRLASVTDQSVCTTIAWGDPAPRLAAEGNIRSSGSTVAWLADLLGVTTDRIAALAEGATSDGVVLVPAFGGLAAPWWDDAAQGLVTGLTLGSGPAQLARAALESIAHQVADVAGAMGPVGALLADGGASANDSLMQIQADLAGVPVRRARGGNLSALGAAHLAGRAAGFPPPAPLDYDDFHPRPIDAPAQRDAWRAAVLRSRS
jgi:glycerol kinase